MKVLVLIPQWAHAHQATEDAIREQIYTAHAWCDSNPKKAPKVNVTRFLWSWMGQARRYNTLMKKPVIKLRVEEVESDMTIEEMQAIRRKNLGGR